MTTPAPPPPAQTQQQAGQVPVAAGVAVAEALASSLTVAAAAGAVAPQLARYRITRAALSVSFGVAMSMPPPTTGIYGPATAYANRQNLMRRAQFVIASARRVTAQLVLARSQGVPLGQALLDAASAERRYYGRHLIASWGRDQAAARIDSESMTHGNLLGWYTVLTPTTTRECLAANGRNFYADAPPPIGWPGMAHPGCRCLPGPPHPGARLVTGVQSRRQYVPAA